jgi:cytochrome P450
VLSDPVTKPAYDPISLSALSFWAQTPERRDHSFAILRDERPVSWQPPAEGALIPQPPGSGYWAVVRHADIATVSKDPAAFCSGRGVMLDNVPEEVSEAANSFLSTDAPRHTRLRRLVSAAFTPRRIATIEQQIGARARRVVDELIATGDCDFVAQVSRPLPMDTIFDMVGLDDRAARDEAVASVDGMTAWSDPDVRADREPVEVLQQSLMSLVGLGMGLITDRRGTRGDDLISNLIDAKVDGQRLTDQEICAFFVLLSVAGNDTTRNTASHAVKALTDFPDQKKLLIDDFDRHAPTATEEFVRWATPVMDFRRTATRDVELGGTQINEGDWVVMFYASGNRDERAFGEPHRFDVTRRPNHHVGFGGGGPHFCMGAQLARAQLRALFGELVRRVPDLETGEPVYFTSNFMSGIRSLPCTLNT